MLRKILRKYVNSNADDWDTHLPWVEYAPNNSPSTSTGYIPFFLTYGFEPVETEWEHDLTLGEHELNFGEDGESNLMDTLLTSLRRGREAMMDAQEAQALQYDMRKQDAGIFEPGDKVMLSAKGISKHVDVARPPKLLPRLLGQFEVVPLQEGDDREWSGLNVQLRLDPMISRIYPVFHRSTLLRYHDPVKVFANRPLHPERPLP